MIDDFRHVVSLVLQRGGDHQSFAGLKAAENPAARRRTSLRIDKSEFSPGVRG